MIYPKLPETDLSALDWQNSVINFLDFTLAEPVVPAIGDRYVNTASGLSNVTGQIVVVDHIYEWNGGDWTDTTPNKGFALLNEFDTVFYFYDGANWVPFGSTTQHNLLAGLDGGIPGVPGEFYHFSQAEHTEATQYATNAQNGLMSASHVQDLEADNDHRTNTALDQHTQYMRSAQSGIGNPNGVVAADRLGQTYKDTASGLMYLCNGLPNSWKVV